MYIHILDCLKRFLPESPKWLMSQGRRRQAWEIMAKLVPTAVYVDTENDNQQQDYEIRKVCLIYYCDIK